MRRTLAERRLFAKAQAERMQRNPTPAERRLRECLAPLGFKFQVPIAGETKNGGPWMYILDAYHKKCGLAVEVDGSAHRKSAGRDRRRDTRLRGEGIITYRFTNKEVLNTESTIFPSVVECSMFP